jgi:hypothetical protein
MEWRNNMSNSSKVEELVEFIVNKDEENAKDRLKDILKEKAKERLLQEFEEDDFRA